MAEITGSRVTSPGGGFAKTSQGSNAIVGAAVNQIGGVVEQYFARKDSDRLKDFTLETEKYLLDLKAKNVLPAERTSLLNRRFRESELPGADILKVMDSIKVRAGTVARVGGELKEFNPDSGMIEGGEVQVKGKMLEASDNISKDTATIQALMPNVSKAFEKGIMANIQNTPRVTAMFAQVQEQALKVGTTMQSINNYRIFNGTTNIGVLDDLKANQAIRAGEFTTALENAMTTIMNPVLARAANEDGNIVTRNALEGTVRALKLDVFSRLGSTFTAQTGLEPEAVANMFDKQLQNVQSYSDNMLSGGPAATENKRLEIHTNTITLNNLIEDEAFIKNMKDTRPEWHDLYVAGRINFVKTFATAMGTLKEVGGAVDAKAAMMDMVDPIVLSGVENGITVLDKMLTDNNINVPKMNQIMALSIHSGAMYNNTDLQALFAKSVKAIIARMAPEYPTEAGQYEKQLNSWFATVKERNLKLSN